MMQKYKGLSPNLHILPEETAPLQPLLETKYWDGQPIGVILSSISYALTFSAPQE